MPVGKSVQKLWAECGKFINAESIHNCPTGYQHGVSPFLVPWLMLHESIEINRRVACAALDVVARLHLWHMLSTELCNTTTTNKNYINT